MSTIIGERNLSDLEEAAKKHLWLHFTPHSNYFKDENPEDMQIIVRGEGSNVYTANGEKKIDAISGLFTVQVGHGRKELADAAHSQMMQLDYFPLWSYAHPSAILLAEKLANYAPGDLNRVFFTTGGGEAVEMAWKLAKHYFKLTGQPSKYKVISRQYSYHGTTQGALSITGIPMARLPYGPLVPGGLKVPNTCFYRAPEHLRHSEVQFGIWAADRIEEIIQFEGPETVAAVFLEPLQNSGGCFPPPPGYLERVRQICDKYNVLFVADETITGFGRLGEMFACNRYNVVPDMICCAKGMSSGYAPIGALIASDKLFLPFKEPGNFMPHGFTFGGHPVSCAVALENLRIIEEELLLENVKSNETYFKQQLETLYDISLVGDVRGAGYFFGIELVKDKVTREMFNDEESHVLIRNFLSKKLFENGLYCRADDRGEPVVQLAPCLTTSREEIDEIITLLRKTLVQAADYMEELGFLSHSVEEISIHDANIVPPTLSVSTINLVLEKDELTKHNVMPRVLSSSHLVA